MKTSSVKLLAISAAALMMCISAVALSSGGTNGVLMSNNVRQLNAVANVNTPYSIILDQSWGYNGESTLGKASGAGNTFDIGFSDGSKFGHADSGIAFKTTEDNLYIYTDTLLNGVSQVYVKGSSTNGKTGVTVYGHYYHQTYCVDDSETVSGALNSLITFSPTKYVAIEFEGIDNIESIEIGYSCSAPDDPYRHLVSGGQNTKTHAMWQSVTGLSTDLPVGSKVTVSMDVSVTGTFGDGSSLVYVDSVWGDDSRNASTSIKSDIITGEEGWHHVSFDATVRNFSLLRWNANYNKADTSSFGNAVYILTENETQDSFNFKNVSIVQSGMTASGNNGNSKDMYYQSLTGLSTDLAVGTTVVVDMDVKVTGTFNSYSHVYWVDSVYTVSGGEAKVNANTLLDSEVLTGDSDWHHITFTATVRNFPALRYGTAYPVVDTSSYGNAVYLLAMNKSADSFDYKDVKLTKVESFVYGKANTTGNGFHESYAGLAVDYPVGTSVTVDMDVLVTGTFDQYSGLWWVDSVYSVAGGERNAATNILSLIDATDKTNWQHITFTATVRNFPALRNNSSQYAVIDTSSVGNAVYLLTQNKSTSAMNYKNVEIAAAMKSGGARSPANGFYQSMAGLCTDLDVGTEVFVDMDVKITGSFNQYASIYCVDSVYSVNGGERKDATNIKSLFDTSDTTNWQHISFSAKVRNFPYLRLNSAYTITDTSMYGNAVYLLTENNDVKAFNYKNVQIKANIERYQIVVSESKFNNSDSPTYYAANVLKESIAEAGGDIEIVSDDSAKCQYEIVLGNTNRYVSGYYNAESYHILNYEGSLHIDAGDNRGIIYGVYSWLESVGFRFYTQNVKTIPSLNSVTVSAINYTHSPEFDYREVVYEDSFKTEFGVAQGVNGTVGRSDIKDPCYGGYHGYINGNGHVHTVIGNPTTRDIVDKVYIDGYGGATHHPEWFAVDENGDPYVDDHDDFAKTQICLSNETLLANAKTWLVYRIQSEVVPSGYDGQSKSILVSQMDNGNYCKCDACQAKYALYGTSGAWLMWVNELAKHVKTSGYSNISIETLAYQWTKELPLGGVTPEDNVAIRFCSDFGGCVADRDDSTYLNHENELLDGWCDICDNVYVYYHAHHYVNYMEVCPNFDDIYYSLHAIHEAGVKGAYVEGLLDEDGEFGELRTYLVSKMLQNPSMTYVQYNALISDFCDAYYGDAGTYVVNYINLMKTALKGDLRCTGTLSGSNMNFTASLKTTAEGYWDDAEGAVSGDATLLARVQKSRLHWTYTMLEFYEEDYDASTYQTLCLDLAQEMYALGIINKHHAAVIEDPSENPTAYQVNPKNWKYVAA